MDSTLPSFNVPCEYEHGLDRAYDPDNYRPQCVNHRVSPSCTMKEFHQFIKNQADPNDERDIHFKVFERKNSNVLARSLCRGDTDDERNVDTTDDMTIESVFGGKEGKNRVQRVYISFIRGNDDIGIFGYHVNAPGSSFLTSMSTNTGISTVDASQEELSVLINTLHGNPDAKFVYVEKVFGLEISPLTKVRDYIDEKFEERKSDTDIIDLDDFKVILSSDDLTSLIGEDSVNALSSLFAKTLIAEGETAGDGEGEMEFVIRRSMSVGKHINFHVDYSYKTMNVALNDESEYEGGRLVYVMKGESDDEVLCLHSPPKRKVGSVLIHGGGIVHGVSKLLSGVRYGLFLLQKQNIAGRRGNAWK